MLIYRPVGTRCFNSSEQVEDDPQTQRQYKTLALLSADSTDRVASLDGNTADALTLENPLGVSGLEARESREEVAHQISKVVPVNVLSALAAPGQALLIAGASSVYRRTANGM